MKTKTLIVDDEATIRNLLQSRLQREGQEVTVAANADEAESELSKGAEYAVMVTDIKMPGKNGIELMAWAKEKWPSLRVVVITGHGEKELAVQALKHGASDYLEKPFDMDELVHSVNRCVREYGLERENRDLVQRLEARIERVEGKVEDQVWYVSKDASMGKVNEWLSVLQREAMRGAAEEPSVLILGESGTGKEGIARMIHAGSRRGKGSWVAVNCANFNEQLLESELFGHERGAFTGAVSAKPGLFELAKGGTLFLDEIGEMDIKLQAKLLRVLQEKIFRRLGGTQDITSDVRVIAATNKNLESRVGKGEFRDDLYHRLNRVVVAMPALRERRGDIVPMAKQFADRAFRARGKTFEGFAPDAEESLRGYYWPGNVRELLNVIERTALLWEGHGVVSVAALGLPNGPAVQKAMTHGGATLTLVQSSGAGESFMELKKKWTWSFEREYVSGLLTKYSGNITAAAREARIDRSNFQRLIRKYGFTGREFRKAA